MNRYLIGNLLLLFSSTLAHAQFRDDAADAYNQKHMVGINAGGTVIDGELKNHPVRDVFSVTYGYNFSEKLRIGVECAAGELYSASPANEWTSGLQSHNNFTTANVNARYSFNNIFNRHGLKNKEIKNRLYWGLGLGYLNNNLSTLTTRFRPDQAPNEHTKSTSSTAVLLENIGMDFKLPKTGLLSKTIFNINFQANYAFSDYVDGYSFKSGGLVSNDVYFTFTAGLHFYFGSRE